MAVSVPNITETLDDLVSSIYFLVGESDDTFPRENVVRLINEATNKVWRAAHRNQEIIYSEIDASTFGVNIPDPVMYEGSAIVESVWIMDAGTQKLMSPQSYSNESTVGTPETYAVRGKALYLYPTPDKTYTVTLAYRREAPVMSDPSGTVDMQDMELTAVKYHVCYVLKVQDEEYDAADRFKSMFDGAIADLIVQEAGVYPAGSLYGSAWAGGSVL